MSDVHEAARTAVVGLAQREWREPVRVFRLDGPDLRYRVPGRRRTGEPRARRPRGEGIALVVGVVLELPAAVAEGMLNLLGRLVAWPFRDVVRGGEGSGAVQFADAFRRGANWLVWSPSRVALVQLRADGTQHLGWAAEGAARPELRLPRRLRWADGSW
ncbi:hypothetical protein, partial [Crossiella equi]